jgi:hypothetical protein
MKATIFYLLLCLYSSQMQVNAGGFFSAIIFDLIVNE